MKCASWILCGNLVAMLFGAACSASKHSRSGQWALRLSLRASWRSEVPSEGLWSASTTELDASALLRWSPPLRKPSRLWRLLPVSCPSAASPYAEACQRAGAWPWGVGDPRMPSSASCAPLDAPWLGGARVDSDCSLGWFDVLP